MVDSQALNPELVEQLKSFDVDSETGLLSLAGQSVFPIYGDTGHVSFAVQYRLVNGQILSERYIPGTHLG